MALNNFKCNHLMPLHFKGLSQLNSTAHGMLVQFLHSKFSLIWPSSFTKLCTSLLLDICMTNCVVSLTCNCEVVSGQRRPIVLAFIRQVSSPLKTGHLPLLAAGYATVSPMTSHRLHHCRYSVRN